MVPSRNLTVRRMVEAAPAAAFCAGADDGAASRVPAEKSDVAESLVNSRRLSSSLSVPIGLMRNHRLSSQSDFCPRLTCSSHLPQPWARRYGAGGVTEGVGRSKLRAARTVRPSVAMLKGLLRNGSPGASLTS